MEVWLCRYHGWWYLLGMEKHIEVQAGGKLSFFHPFQPIECQDSLLLNPFYFQHPREEIHTYNCSIQAKSILAMWVWVNLTFKPFLFSCLMSFVCISLPQSVWFDNSSHKNIQLNNVYILHIQVFCLTYSMSEKEKKIL